MINQFQNNHAQSNYADIIFFISETFTFCCMLIDFGEKNQNKRFLPWINYNRH